MVEYKLPHSTNKWRPLKVLGVQVKEMATAINLVRSLYGENGIVKTELRLKAESYESTWDNH